MDGDDTRSSAIGAELSKHFQFSTEKSSGACYS